MRAEVRPSKSGRALTLGLALLAFGLAPAAAWAEIDPPRARLTLRYQEMSDGVPNPETEDFLYFENGLTLLNHYFFLDFNTPMGLVLLEGIGTVIAFLAGGSTAFPLMAALNPGEREAAPITIFEIAAGGQVFKVGPFHLGAGAFFEWSWISSYFDDERLNYAPIDFGPMAQVWFDDDLLDATLGIVAGNAWHDYGNWNPFLTIMSAVEVPLWRKLALHVSGRVQARRWAFTKYEAQYLNQIPTETVAIETSTVSWALEIGPSIHF